ncbi:MAG: hypothetical protein ACK4RW_00110 [Rehaibacterium terrae]|uniref:hypothetical protein n=1 Tax=Rehaibacterium terrae TaxID=1341696 RepID=UPI00391AC7C8
MVKQVKARRANRTPQVNSHTLWLAGLGAVSLARKQAVKAVALAQANVAGLRERAVTLAGELGGRMSAVKAEADARLRPLLARFGYGGKRKPAARKAPARRRPARAATGRRRKAA